VAFVVGYAVIVAFLKLVSVRSYMVFVVYRVLLGVAVLVMLQLGVLSAH
jgi:undecaprenyl-diphosphatase